LLQQRWLDLGFWWINLSFEELTWKEKEQLGGRSLIAALIVFILIFVYFNYLMYTDRPTSLWDLMLSIGFLSVFVPMTVAILVYEFLYIRKTQGSFNTRRFAGRLLLILVCGLSFFGLVGIMVEGFSLILSEVIAICLGALLWALVFFFIVIRFRQSFNKLTEGKW
jgi:hypothetical protein